jgi:hypothetical protein
MVSPSHCLPLPPPPPAPALAAPGVSGGTLLQTLVVTLLVLAAFVTCRAAFESVRHQFARVTVIIIGAGPVGLLCAVVASRNPRVSREGGTPGYEKGRGGGGGRMNG